MKAGHLDMNEFLFTEVQANEIVNMLVAERNYQSIIDVGGRSKELRFDSTLIHTKTNIVDLKHCVIDDICNSKLESESFDIVYSHDVFEHLLEPWKAAEHCVRICKTGGLLYHVTLFCWPLHVDPVDCFRYTHIGLAHLFERTNLVKTINCGFSEFKRSHWRVTYLGQKR